MRFPGIDELVSVRWFFTDKPPLPFPTVYCSRNWESEKPWDDVVGEVPGVPRPWVNGARPPGVKCGGPVGEPDAWVDHVSDPRFVHPVWVDIEMVALSEASGHNGAFQVLANCGCSLFDFAPLFDRSEALDAFAFTAGAALGSEGRSEALDAFTFTAGAALGSEGSSEALDSWSFWTGQGLVSEGRSESQDTFTIIQQGSMGVTVKDCDDLVVLNNVTTLCFDPASGFEVVADGPNGAEITLTVPAPDTETLQDALVACLTDSSTTEWDFDDGANTLTCNVKQGALTPDRMTFTATNTLLGRFSASGGDGEEIAISGAVKGFLQAANLAGAQQSLDLEPGVDVMAFSATLETIRTTTTFFSLTLFDDADAPAWRTTLGLGTLATQSTLSPADIAAVIVGTSATSVGAVRMWYEFTLTYNQFAAASTSNSVSIFTLPALGAVHTALMWTTTAWTGPGIVSVSLTVGHSLMNSAYSGMHGANVVTPDTAVTYTSAASPVRSIANTTDVRVYASSSGGNLNALTQGVTQLRLEMSYPDK